MDAIRIIQKPKNGKVTVSLPEELKTKDMVEIVIFPYEEVHAEKAPFDPKEYFGAGKLNMSESEIESEAKKLRGEWQRSS